MTQHSTDLNGPIIGALGIIIGVLITGGLTLFRDYKKDKNSEKQRRQKVYSQLLGLRNLLVELIATNVENSFGIDSYIIRSELENEPKDYDHAYQLDERNAKLRLEVAKCIQKLFEIVGSSINLFHIAADDQMIKDLYDKLDQISRIHDNPEFKIPEFKTSEDLHKWKTDVQEKITKNVVPMIASPIDNLLMHMENELKKDQAVKWWQFQRRAQTAFTVH